LTTAGGNVTLDGKTIVNSSTNQFTFDSSVANNTAAGGNITLKNTLDSNSAGSQSTTFQAGAGNIIFEDNVGGNSPFLDFSVAGAGTLNSKNITVDGNLTLEVINNIKTNNLSVGALTTISLGKVGDEVYNSTGNLTTGNITTQGLNVLNNGNFTAGEITSTDGDVEIIALKNISVNKITGISSSVNLTSGTGQIVLANFTRADNGFIALAKQSILTQGIKSTEDAVILKSRQGEINVQETIESYDDVSLAASKRVIANQIKLLLPMAVLLLLVQQLILCLTMLSPV
jgi:hypothetical protein